MPFAGDAVTDTHAPAGTNADCASALLSGSSSNVGSASARPRPARPAAPTTGRRRSAALTDMALDVRIREGRLAAGDEVGQGLVDGRVDRRRLVAREHPLPDLVRSLRGVERPVLLPLLVGVVVGDLRAIERGLEVGERVGGAEEVLAGAVLADRVERLAVLRQVHAT